MTFALPPLTDPCLCPSGRSFGDCHALYATTDDARRSTLLNAIDDVYTEELTAYYKRVGWRPKRPPRKHPRLHYQLDEPNYIWFARRQMLFEDADVDGRTVVDRFLDDQGASLPPLHRAFLEAQNRTRTRVWRLEGVVPRVGLDFADVHTGERRFVHEVGSSPMFVGKEGAVVLARVVTLDGLSIASGIHLDLLTPKLALDVLMQGATNGFDLGELWERAIEEECRPRYSSLRDFDGNAIEPTLDRYVFRHEKGGEVITSLAQVPGVQLVPICQGAVGFKVHSLPKDPDGPSKGESVVVGKGVFCVSELVLETSSPKRADAVCGRIERACKPHIHHLGREHGSADDYFDRFVIFPGGGPEWMVCTTKHETDLLRIKNDIVERWLMEPNRTLGGHTPAEATQTVRGRCRLGWMLDRLALLESKVPVPVRFDVPRVRRRLGLDDAATTGHP